MTDKPLQYKLLQDQIFSEDPFILIKKGAVCTLDSEERCYQWPVQGDYIPTNYRSTIETNPQIFQEYKETTGNSSGKTYSSNRQIDLAQFKTDMICDAQIIHSAEIPKSLVKPSLLFLILQELRRKNHE